MLTPIVTTNLLVSTTVTTNVKTIGAKILNKHLVRHEFNKSFSSFNRLNVTKVSKIGFF